MNLTQLKNIAIQAALEAGAVIQRYLNEDIVVEHKKKGGSSYASQVVTEVDRACETIILKYLLPTCETFGIAILSEETVDDGGRFHKDFFWCIDPMDGTLAFIEKRSGFSVSIALVSQDGTPLIAVVYDPSSKNLYHAIKGAGAYKNNNSWKIKRANNHLSYVNDRKLKDNPRSEELEKLLNNMTMELGLNEVQEISGAGAVMNAILVLENSPACMIKLPKKESGGGSLWDYAATACIYNELRLPATNYEGGRLNLNKKDNTFMNQKGIYFANFT